MKACGLVIALLLAPVAARAAAWTQSAGTWQFISSTVYSGADVSFDNHGHLTAPRLFSRLLEQNDIAYGLTDSMTVFVRGDIAKVQTQALNEPRTDALSTAVEGGLRWRLPIVPHLLSDYDVMSIEAMGRSAGAYNFSYSANAMASGRTVGVRLLYGAPFKAWGHDGFIDLEVGERWLSQPRPTETVMDLTAGLWLGKNWLVMAQNFNVISGPARQPYVYYRSHKLQASLAWKVSRRLTLQVGAFFSPAGQNTLDERGLVLSVWKDF